MSSKVQHKNFKGSALSGAMMYAGLGLLGLGGALTIGTYVSDSGRFWSHAVIAFMFLLSLGLGGLFYVALEYLVGAFWSVPVRRINEAMSGFLYPLTVIGLLITVITIFYAGHSSPYHHWLPAPHGAHHGAGGHGDKAHHGEKKAHGDSHAKDAHAKTDKGADSHAKEGGHDDHGAHGHDPIIESKRWWLTEMRFFVAVCICFFFWLLFRHFFVSQSRKQDVTGDHKITLRSSQVAAPFMLVFAGTISIAAVNWLMTIEPHWFSTMFGVYYFAGTLVSSAALLTIMSVILREGGFLHPKLQRDSYYSLGLMLFAFNTFWAYIAFSQFMLIWYANLPEETMWFVARYEGGWMYMSLFMILFHFAIPFFALLSRTQKTNPNRLLFMSMWLLVAHYMDLYWVVMPANPHGGFGLTDIGFVLFASGFVLFFFSFFAQKASLTPEKDPKLAHALEFRLH